MKYQNLKKIAMLARADGLTQAQITTLLAEKCSDTKMLSDVVTQICAISEDDFTEIKKDFVTTCQPKI